MDNDTTDPSRLDLVVFGATGFTGRLVAEHLADRGEAALHWGIAGRDRARLDEIADGLDHDDVPIIVADAHDRPSLDRLADSAATIISTVGPYAQHGEQLVAACVAAGTDYVDLTGEPQFVRRVIDAHQDDATRSGARIVHSCGFDSIPSDLGTLIAQQAMHERHGTYATRVHLRVKGARGGMSGGTISSLVNVLADAAVDPLAADVIRDPHSLLPAGERYGAHTPDRTGASYDETLGSWIGPFVMEVVNARIVRRTNALLGYPWGHDFRYDEAVATGDGPKGRAFAQALAAAMRSARASMSVAPLRSVIERFLPTDGVALDEGSREGGYFKLIVVAEHPTDRAKDVQVDVVGDRDPGYGATSRMIGEAGLTLAAGESDVPGGIWTPASALGDALRSRLAEHAGVTFTVRD